MMRWRPGLVALAVALGAAGAGAPAVLAAGSAAASGPAAVAPSPAPRAVPPRAGFGGPGPATPGSGPQGPGGPFGGGPGRGAPPGLPGTVSAVSASGFTLKAGGTTYHVRTTSATTYLLAPGWATSRAAVAAGEEAAVRGPISGADITARTVLLHLWGVAGSVTAVHGDTVTLTQPSGRTATLRFAAAPDVSRGTAVEAAGSWRGDTLTVRAWRVLPAKQPAPAGLRPASAGAARALP